MKRCVFPAMMWLLATLASPKAEAFVEDPFITPSAPTPDTPIAVRVHAGVCHAFSDDVDEAELVVVGPGQLRLMTEGVNLPPAHPFCIYPDFVYRFDIGTLPAGSYTLQLFINDPFAGPEPVGFGSVSFVVSAPHAIPAASPVGLALLGLLLAGLSARVLRFGA
ncbi:MAG: hypothetical protein LKM39_01695 [Chiayiivirga sp.]|jgi:hypothetical protein|nr:hypothetical protein [Chiayiivirga sp.]